MIVKGGNRGRTVRRLVVVQRTSSTAQSRDRGLPSDLSLNS